jgi:simple sugar transport system ATP-binding protein|tara:strand:+ start:229 stop:969 length:741 start_codon:yes stop_codon:yes gene_type:complete
MSILSLKNISKNFGAIEALINVDLNLDKGQVVGLMGDNGAGKSTLVKIIAGVFQANSGEILYNNQQVKFSKPIDARRSGIEVVYQDLALCDNLTAADNIFLSRELFKKFFYISFLDYKKMYDVSQGLFDELKSETRPKDEVKTMSGGQRQAVAIARTKLTDAKIVLMDEPTASISVRQIAEVLDYIRQLRDRGISIILVSHRMPDVFEVSDRIVVLRRGGKVADKKISSSSPEEVTALITGALKSA